MSRFDTMHFEDLPREKQIERWENVERVLHGLPRHERRKHWDMGHWGRITDCGTVACAAGHCGMDPWFKRRGFRLIPSMLNGWFTVNVDTFFGMHGTNAIFLNTNHRPVGQVIREVRQYIKELKALPVNEV